LTAAREGGGGKPSSPLRATRESIERLHKQVRVWACAAWIIIIIITNADV
jgi:hypothetical protein